MRSLQLLFFATLFFYIAVICTPFIDNYAAPAVETASALPKPVAHSSVRARHRATSQKQTVDDRWARPLKPPQQDANVQFWRVYTATFMLLCSPVLHWLVWNRVSASQRASHGFSLLTISGGNDGAVNWGQPSPSMNGSYQQRPPDAWHPSVEDDGQMGQEGAGEADEEAGDGGAQVNPRDRIGHAGDDDAVWEQLRDRFREEAKKEEENPSRPVWPDATPANEHEEEIEFLKSLKYNKAPRGYGFVSSWNDFHGYGFIRPTCGGPDLFVHATELHSDPTTGYRDAAVGELVYYDIAFNKEGKPQAANVTGYNGAYVRGRRDGGFVLEEEAVVLEAAPKKKGVIRDFTESKYWSTERVPDAESTTAGDVPEVPSPPNKWWED